MTDLQNVFEDLNTESEEIDEMVAGLDASRWRTPTPAPDWTIAHQVGHLTFIFNLAGTAAADPDTFQKMVAGAQKDFSGAVNAALAHYMDEPSAMLARWRAERAAAVKSLAAFPPDQVVPWLVRPLPPAILACAGIMEVFGHGQDIADALGIRLVRTDRIRHLTGFAVLVWDFGYLSRGLTPPDVQFRFELTAPSGELWTYGPADAAQRITGPAEDFCLLVTRRRHRDDLSLVATGEDADRWLDIAQAYRGPAGPGRRPGQFAKA
ncbi:wyosine base formation [Microtetraspora sp. NBRC 13810]|uniref:TIGR03084 family metal-binding protein n=1 Tax=Microtetraspora sp. NBRC 13810 TaxID=3030990 RepID=UPI0024A0E126|nr:TIGR03084 family metal-binding protein [Microtetraspora sp. NBRC 13810]GLW05801.1 wyosine base formation [Microtetraspora sp. NBRC 13810]